MQPDYVALEQAAEWFAVLSDARVDEAQREAWRHWLAASPGHTIAWQRVERISGQFQVLPAAQRVVARSALQSAGPSRRQVLASLLLVGGGSALGLGTAHLPWRGWVADQRSAVGQIRQVGLIDGGQLWLNSNSAVDIVYDTTQRLLRLWQGELLLDSAADIQRPARPLLVETEHGRLQALGTRFSVRKDEQGTRLSVFEGAVRVTSLAGLSQVAQAGEELLFDRQRISPVMPARAARQAWQRGVLLADERTLADFIAELAEHVPGHLAVDPRVANLRLVGAFPLQDPERIFAALEASLPVRVRRRWHWWLTLEPRDV